MSPYFCSRIHNILVLILAKYISVAEFGNDDILKPAIEVIRKLESVRFLSYCCDLYMLGHCFLPKNAMQYYTSHECTTITPMPGSIDNWRSILRCIKDWVQY